MPSGSRDGRRSAVEHSVRGKFERYVASEPFSADRRRQAYTAIAAKMTQIAHAVVKTAQPYRSYFEHDLPRGSIPVNSSRRGACDLVDNVRTLHGALCVKSGERNAPPALTRC